MQIFEKLRLYARGQLVLNIAKDFQNLLFEEHIPQDLVNDVQKVYRLATELEIALRLLNNKLQ